MEEKIILAPGANGSEILRSLAKFGRNNLGMRIVGSLELARIALMRSGICTSEGFLSRREEPALVYSFIRSIPYFASASYKDAEALAESLSLMRKLVKGDEKDGIEKALKGGEFKDKNDALAKAYEEYTKLLKDKGLADSISIVRKAISEAAPFKASFCILKEYPLMPLDEEILEHVSGGTYEVLDLPSLFGKEKEKASGDIESMTAAYGAVNEAEDILSSIIREDIPLDKCIIACADTEKYGQLFYDLSRRYDIPMTFGNGIPINNTYPAALLKLLLKWNSFGYNGIDALKNVIFSSAFSRYELCKVLGIELKGNILEKLSEYAGNLRLSFDAAENEKKISKLRSLGLDNDEQKMLDLAEKLAKELELGYSGIIRKYAAVREDAYEKADRSALSVICSFLDAYAVFSGGSDPEEMIPDILRKTVSSESSREGALHVCSIQAAMACPREHLFICGLSSAAFPGSPSENFLLLDSDLDAFGCKTAPTSKERINRRKEELGHLLSEAASLGAKTRLSYPDFDLANIKEQNPSSVLFEIYEERVPGGDMEGFRKGLRHVGYFGSGLSCSDAAGKEILTGKEAEGTPDKQELFEGEKLLERSWSPTALELFFSCPRHFYLKYVCGIKEEEEDDPFEVMNAAEQGNLVHHIMEHMANSTISKKDFLDYSENAFEEWLLRRPPLHRKDKERLKEEFMEMMSIAYDQDPKNRVIDAENDFEATHKSGIKVYGKPDRVEETPAGKYIIADFKTKRNIEHVQNHIDSCLQVVVYSWLLKQNGTDITKAEYRNLRKGKSIECAINDAMLDLLDAKFDEFLNALKTGDFPRNPGKNKANCKYCKFSDICDWPDKEKKAENEDKEEKEDEQH